MPPDPHYLRKRLPEKIEKRDKWWRRDAHIAIDEALRAGEIVLHVATVIRAALSFSDDQGAIVWASQRQIGVAMGGRSERTARRWLRRAEALGFVEVEHRSQRVEGGRFQQLSNLTRVILPAAIEARRQERKAGGKGAPTPKAPQNRPTVGERPITIDPERQQQAAEAVAATEELLVARSAPRAGSGLRERVVKIANRAPP